MRKKLLRFQDNAQAANLIQPGKASYQTLQGQWAPGYFSNEQDIVLELGCGQGEYTVGLAEKFPNRNFIGVDIKGARLWLGSMYAHTHGLVNVAFLRTDITQIDNFFAPGEVAEIYLPFPDPHPRNSDAKKRLTSPRFLNLYKKILRPGGKVHLKTDNDQLFAYTLDLLGTQPYISDLVYSADFHHDGALQGQNLILTKYEKKYLHQGIKIKYLCFKFK
jgi:tRNA (guanine-N7-)-methyltransferase